MFQNFSIFSVSAGPVTSVVIILPAVAVGYGPTDSSAGSFCSDVRVPSPVLQIHFVHIWRESMNIWRESMNIFRQLIFIYLVVFVLSLLTKMAISALLFWRLMLQEKILEFPQVAPQW
jgi:hypothetical protein